MMFAQEPIQVTSTSGWAIVSGIIGMLMLNISKWISDWRKDQRDSRDEDAKQAILTRIAESNDEAIKAQGDVRVAIEGLKGSIHEWTTVSGERFGVIKTSIENSCRAECPNSPVVNVAQRKKDSQKL